MNPNKLAEHTKKWRLESKGLGTKQLHWHFAESVRQASYFKGSGTIAAKFYEKKADFFLNEFEKAKNKERRNAERVLERGECVRIEK